MKDYRAAYTTLMKVYPLGLENLDNEEWRDINGYAGYQISNYGRVKSFKYKEPRILKPVFARFGYLKVTLCKRDRRISCVIHRLVAENFIPKIDDKPHVNHKDGHKLNNHVSNLEWVTSTENQQHAYKMGLLLSGQDCTGAKLNNEQVIYIRKNIDELTMTELANMFNVTVQTISYIQRGMCYKNAGGTIRTKQNFGEYCRVPDETRIKIRAEWSTGNYTYTALAKKYAVDRSTVRNIVNEK